MLRRLLSRDRAPQVPFRLETPPARERVHRFAWYLRFRRRVVKDVVLEYTVSLLARLRQLELPSSPTSSPPPPPPPRPPRDATRAPVKKRQKKEKKQQKARVREEQIEGGRIAGEEAAGEAEKTRVKDVKQPTAQAGDKARTTRPPEATGTPASPTPSLTPFDQLAEIAAAPRPPKRSTTQTSAPSPTPPLTDDRADSPGRSDGQVLARFITPAANLALAPRRSWQALKAADEFTGHYEIFSTAEMLARPVGIEPLKGAKRGVDESLVRIVDRQRATTKAILEEDDNIHDPAYISYWVDGACQSGHYSCVAVAYKEKKLLFERMFPTDVRRDNWSIRAYRTNEELSAEETELLGILHALFLARDRMLATTSRNFKRGREVVAIYSDALGVIEQIGAVNGKRGFPSGTLRYLLVGKAQALCRNLQRGGAQIVVHWVKGHAKIPGNELANEVAKRGSYGFLPDIRYGTSISSCPTTEKRHGAPRPPVTQEYPARFVANDWGAKFKPAPKSQATELPSSSPVSQSETGEQSGSLRKNARKSRHQSTPESPPRGQTAHHKTKSSSKSQSHSPPAKATKIGSKKGRSGFQSQEKPATSSIQASEGRKAPAPDSSPVSVGTSTPTSENREAALGSPPNRGRKGTADDRTSARIDLAQRARERRNPAFRSAGRRQHRQSTHPVAKAQDKAKGSSGKPSDVGSASRVRSSVKRGNPARNDSDGRGANRSSSRTRRHGRGTSMSKPSTRGDGRNNGHNDTINKDAESGGPTGVVRRYLGKSRELVQNASNPANPGKGKEASLDRRKEEEHSTAPSSSTPNTKHSPGSEPVFRIRKHFYRERHGKEVNSGAPSVTSSNMWRDRGRGRFYGIRKHFYGD